MKYLSLLILIAGTATTSFAKSWRINNNAGVVADFTSFAAAANDVDVKSGDTIYLEPSVTDYSASSISLAKRLVVIGPGYYLDPTNTTVPGNAGLQALPYTAAISHFYFAAGSAGSKFMGVTIRGCYIYGVNDLTFERVLFTSTLTFQTGASSNITIRKCFFESAAINHSGSATLSNFVCENNIFYSNSYVDLPILTGSSNIIRNNSWNLLYNQITLVNAYFVNNIVGNNSQCSLTNCTIKNNLFQLAQTLPGTATNNLVSQNMADIFVGTGSMDARFKIKAGSPASGAGLTVGAVVSPDCGAFGATNPYVLSGIPNVPTIYTFTAPTSIPFGSPTMNVNFSTRNNN